jgi:glucosamine--fructose-6-phosphate aminotransferase (isomerizing)
MNPFLEDVRDQPRVLRAVLGAYRGECLHLLDEAVAAIRRRPDRPLLVVGMGSSLSAGRILPALMATQGRVVILEDAGELLHYTASSTATVGAVIAISQSGRSFETVRLIESIRDRDAAPVVSLINDEDSPLAATSDVILPLLAGAEAAIATKTYLAAMTVLLLLAERLAPDLLPPSSLDRAVATLDGLVLDRRLGEVAADHLAGSRALYLIGRGPALGTAAYGALTIKEVAAIPAEGMSGGAFRHGPLELTETQIGVVVLAPAGRTQRLMTSLAAEVAGHGRAIWLLTFGQPPDDDGSAANVLVTDLGPELPEEVAPLVMAVPLQLAAEALARQVGRRAGVTLVATKVTERE